MGKVRDQKCCNPFSVSKHPKYVVIYTISAVLVTFARKRNIDIKKNQVICKACRNKLYKIRENSDENVARSVIDQPSTSSGNLWASSSCQSTVTDMDYVDSLIGGESVENSSDEDGGEDDDFDVSLIDTDAVKKCVNDLLGHLDLKEMDGMKMRGKRYQLELFNNLMKRLSQCLFPKATVVSTNNGIVEKLKDKFEKTSDRNMRMKILSLLPEEWSVRAIKKIFVDASYYMIQQSKKLVKKNGILCDTTKKPGTKIPENILTQVKEFYCSDEISRPCPGMRDFVKLYDNTGEKCKIQRRLVLMNLREAYQLFKIKYPDAKIGFSKFASVRPPQCILAGSAHGIHTTCVCTYHQNIKLMLNALQKLEIVDRAQTYRDLMQMLLCSEPNNNCRLNKCDLCSGIDGNEHQAGLRTVLFERFEEKIIESITFKQWTNSGS